MICERVNGELRRGRLPPAGTAEEIDLRDWPVIESFLRLREKLAVKEETLALLLVAQEISLLGDILTEDR